MIDFLLNRKLCDLLKNTGFRLKSEHIDADGIRTRIYINEKFEEIGINDNFILRRKLLKLEINKEN